MPPGSTGTAAADGSQLANLSKLNTLDLTLSSASGRDDGGHSYAHGLSDLRDGLDDNPYDSDFDLSRDYKSLSKLAGIGKLREPVSAASDVPASDVPASAPGHQRILSGGEPTGPRIRPIIPIHRSPSVDRADANANANDMYKGSPDSAGRPDRPGASLFRGQHFRRSLTLSPTRPKRTASAGTAGAFDDDFDDDLTHDYVSPLTTPSASPPLARYGSAPGGSARQRAKTSPSKALAHHSPPPPFAPDAAASPEKVLRDEFKALIADQKVVQKAVFAIQERLVLQLRIARKLMERQGIPLEDVDEDGLLASPDTAQPTDTASSAAAKNASRGSESQTAATSSQQSLLRMLIKMLFTIVLALILHSTMNIYYQHAQILLAYEQPS